MILYVVRNKKTGKYRSRSGDNDVVFENAQFYHTKNPATARKNWQQNPDDYEVLGVHVVEPDFD